MFYFMKEKHLMDQSNEVKCTVARRHWFQQRQGVHLAAAHCVCFLSTHRYSHR